MDIIIIMYKYMQGMHFAGSSVECALFIFNELFLTLYALNCFEITQKYICIFYHYILAIMRWQG